MHSVGAKNHEIRAGLFELRSFGGQAISRFGPTAGVLQFFDFVEIDAAQDELCGMKATKALCNRSVDDLIIGNCRFPTHATEQANRFHSTSSFDRQTPNVTFSGAPLAGRPPQGGVGSLRTKKWEQPEYDLSLL